MSAVLLASGMQVGLGGLLLLFGSGPAFVAAFLAAIVAPGKRLVSAAVVWGVGFLVQCVFLISSIMDSRSLAMALMPGVTGSGIAALAMYVRARVAATSENDER